MNAAYVQLSKHKEAFMSVIKELNLVTIPKASATDPKVARRAKLIAHLEEQRAIACAELEGKTHAVKKKRWELTETGDKNLVEVDKRLKRWWTQVPDGSLVLALRWGSKTMEFEKGKTGIAVDNLKGLVATLDKLIKAAAAGEFDAMIAALNQQRGLPKKKAA